MDQIIYGMVEVERALIKIDNYNKSEIDNMEMTEYDYLVEKLTEELSKDGSK